MATEDLDPIGGRVDALLTALGNGETAVVRQILAGTPGIAAFSIHAACAAADPDAVLSWPSRHPALVSAPHGPHATPPIVYACASRAHERSPETASASTRVVQLLLDHGADANAFTSPADARSARLTALYFACASNHVGAARLLLEHGADPNDGESIYHAAQDGHLACLSLLLAHGARIGERHPGWRNTPLYFLAGHHDERGGQAPWIRGFRWLLEHGADPNAWSYDVRETPLHAIARHGDCPIAARLLLEHGADPLLARGDGRQPYALSVRSGNSEIIALLRSRTTAPPILTPVDEFLGACLQGDERQARSILAAHPDLMNSLTDEDRSVLPQAAGRGLVDAVRVMTTMGFDLEQEDHNGGTPLHWAAWWGRRDVVELLIDRHAPINARDKTYGSSPVAWAAHGSRFCREADDAYCAIVEMLLGAGADYRTSINKWGESPITLGSERVSAVFRRRGFGT